MCRRALGPGDATGEATIGRYYEQLSCCERLLIDIVLALGVERRVQCLDGGVVAVIERGAGVVRSVVDDMPVDEDFT